MPKYPNCSEEEKRSLRMELNLPENARIGIYVGRVTKEKGLSYLVDALKQLDESWPPELCLLIVGNGDYLQEMQSECAALRHTKRVIFAGQQEQIQAYLNASDFFLSPSLHENLSISILEACAAKLPCLVTDVGGNGEIIESGKNGLMIAASSTDALASGLRKMSDDKCRAEIKRRAEQVDYSKKFGKMSPQDILSILEREKVISLSDGRSRKVSVSEFAFFFSLEYDDKTNIWLADINLDFEKEPEANPVSPFYRKYARYSIDGETGRILDVTYETRYEESEYDEVGAD